MTRPEKLLRRVRHVLKGGDVLARLDGGGFALVRAGFELDPALAYTLLHKPFGGGRLHPSGDHLPGIEAPSQTWSWQPDARPAPAPASAHGRAPGPAHTPAHTLAATP